MDKCVVISEDVIDLVAALEADNKEADRLLLTAAMKYTALEIKLKGRPSAEQFAIVLEDRENAEVKLAEFENDEVPTRRELRLRRRQLDGIGELCIGVLNSDDRFVYLGQLPAEWYALRDAITIVGKSPDDGFWMKVEDLDLLESDWEDDYGAMR